MPETKMKWIVATRNRDKLGEIRAIFADLPIHLEDIEAFPHVGEVEETGTNLVENALLKARTIQQATGLPAIADDTGLEVDALNGEPGIYAARFAGPMATYRENQAKLLSLMKGVPLHDRTARFKTCAVYIDDDHELVAEGVVEGAITLSCRGEYGFGYDPVFMPEGESRTFGEMTEQEKRKISHRARAFRALHELITQSFSLQIDRETSA
ncbi:dITP/XTP pyrophosphatase [subsurface metagenome]